MKHHIFILFGLSLLLPIWGCKSIDNKTSTSLFKRNQVERNFVCSSDTSVCYEGIQLGQSKFEVFIKNLRIKKNGTRLIVSLIIKDGKDAVPDVSIIKGKLFDSFIKPLDVIGKTNKLGYVRIEFKILYNNVIYLNHAGYATLVYKVDNFK